MELVPRECLILESVIQNFIETANPVGSRLIAKKLKMCLSPATVRNVLMDLEDKGLLYQPHVSAGRIPTDQGYRVFVDKLMKRVKLSSPEKKRIQENLDGIVQNVDVILIRASQVLGEISKQLGVVLAPRFFQGVCENIKLINMSENKILVVISIKSGLVRTIIMEIATSVSDERLEGTARFLNERLCGLTLREIKESIDQRLKDVGEGDIGLIKLIINSADDLFDFDEHQVFHFGGTHHIVGQPEFANQNRAMKILELIENKRNIIVHVLNECLTNSISIMIGGENNIESMKDFSVISSTYRLGDITGVLGILGPTRMQYAKMIALVDYMADSMSDLLNRGNIN
ncbi:hypothetical protein AMJ86_00515 [bacterium SM23_57]|nr:MAG: hypothetical protein AMJ86_00515 [bacterium SM23_57]